MNHHHKCPSCDTVWSHDPENYSTWRSFFKEHSCPSCGKFNATLYTPPNYFLRCLILGGLTILVLLLLSYF